MNKYDFNFNYSFIKLKMFGRKDQIHEGGNSYEYYEETEQSVEKLTEKNISKLLRFGESESPSLHIKNT